MGWSSVRRHDYRQYVVRWLTVGWVANEFQIRFFKWQIVWIVDDDDRRSLLVELTDEGLDLVDQALTDHMANEKAVLAKLNASQTKPVATASQVMLDQLI